MSQDGPIIGIDLDCTCAKHDEAFAKHYAEDIGVDPASLPPKTTWSFEKEWGLKDEDLFEHHSEAVEEGLYYEMEPYAGVAETIQKLIDTGYRIRIITHRLYAPGNHENTVIQTAKWLDKHRIPYHDLCLIDDKTDVEADVYIEDAPHNIQALLNDGEPVIIPDQLYNRDFNAPRFQNWNQVFDLVQQATGQKYEQGNLFAQQDPLEEIAITDDIRYKAANQQARMCGAPTAKNQSAPCRRLVAPGNRCPHHQR